MIEFKAECGHTVRARDEDGGGVVRCSYCGKPATVPEGSGDDLDFLFTDVEQSTDNAKSSRRRWGKGRAAAKRRKAPGQFNPFAVVLRLCYAALLIIIILVVGDRFIIPLFQEGGVRERVSRTPGDDPPPDEPPRPDGKPGSVRFGWIKKALPGTLYASSVPAGASVFCISADDALPQGRVRGGRNAIVCSDGICKPRGFGRFVVEVAMNVQHGHLKHGPDYYDFRKRLRDATSAKQRNHAAERYFIPDGSEMFVDEDQGQMWIIRQYRDVERRKDRPTAVRALFLPRIPHVSGHGFSVDALVRDEFIPGSKNYRFDDAEVSVDLEKLHAIPKVDRDAIIEALRRIGVIAFVTPDGRTRLFSIDVQQGWLADTEITDPAP